MKSAWLFWICIYFYNRWNILACDRLVYWRCCAGFRWYAKFSNMSFTVRRIEDPTIHVRRNIKPDIFGKRTCYFACLSLVFIVAELFIIWFYALIITQLTTLSIRCLLLCWILGLVCSKHDHKNPRLPKNFTANLPTVFQQESCLDQCFMNLNQPNVHLYAMIC